MKYTTFQKAKKKKNVVCVCIFENNGFIYKYNFGHTFMYFYSNPHRKI